MCVEEDDCNADTQRPPSCPQISRPRHCGPQQRTRRHVRSARTQIPEIRDFPKRFQQGGKPAAAMLLRKAARNGRMPAHIIAGRQIRCSPPSNPRGSTGASRSIDAAKRIGSIVKILPSEPFRPSCRPGGSGAVGRSLTEQPGYCGSNLERFSTNSWTIQSGVLAPAVTPAVFLLATISGLNCCQDSR